MALDPEKIVGKSMAELLRNLRAVASDPRALEEDRSEAQSMLRALGHEPLDSATAKFIASRMRSTNPPGPGVVADGNALVLGHVTPEVARERLRALEEREGR